MACENCLKGLGSLQKSNSPEWKNAPNMQLVTTWLHVTFPFSSQRMLASFSEQNGWHSLRDFPVSKCCNLWNSSWRGEWHSIAHWFSSRGMTWWREWGACESPAPAGGSQHPQGQGKVAGGGHGGHCLSAALLRRGTEVATQPEVFLLQRKGRGSRSWLIFAPTLCYVHREVQTASWVR